MYVLLVYMFLTHICLHACYDMICPKKSQWYLRSIAICNSTDLYGCLFDEMHNTYAERCLLFHGVERIGNKNVFRGGIDRVPCENNRFQPFLFSTNGNTECVFAKSVCSLEGQVIFADGDSYLDRTCRCDYTLGYAFVHAPAEKCKCNPIMEDCTCYQKHCSLGSVLSPVQNWKGSIKCPQIDVHIIKEEDEHRDILKIFPMGNMFGPRYTVPLYTTIFLTLFLIGCGVLTSYIFQKHNCSYFGTNINIDSENFVRFNRTQTASSTKEHFDCSHTLDTLTLNTRKPLSSRDPRMHSFHAEYFDPTYQLDTIASNARKRLSLPDPFLHSFHADSSVKLLKIAADFKEQIFGIISPANKLFISQRNKMLEMWRTQSEFFVKTSVFEKILKCTKQYNCVLITGEDGTGKTSLLRNVILSFETEGYDIFPITEPHYIEKLYRPFKKTVFFVENICGRFDSVYYDIQSWKSWEIYIKSVLQDKHVKLIFSCRYRVFKDAQFQNLKLYHSCICNLTDETYKYSENDLREIANIYDIRHITELDKVNQVYTTTECIPLLCSLYKILKQHDDISINDFFMTPYLIYEGHLKDMIRNSHFGKYCALALCVMFNNRIEKAFFLGNISDDIKVLVNATCKACSMQPNISISELLDAFKSLEGMFLKEKHGVYSTVHNKLFDFLIFFFGKNITECIIKHAQIRVIMQRFIFNQSLVKSNEFKIEISDDVLHLYFDRLLLDWSNREVINVFSNTNLTDEYFLEKFIQYISEHCSQTTDEQLANMIDIELKETPLTMSCSKGLNAFVSWLLKNFANVNECRYDGASPLLLACIAGNSGVVTQLLRLGTDKDLNNIDGIYPLHAACLYNNYEIVKLLLQNDVDPNLCTKQGLSPLMLSSENGNFDIVSYLLQQSVDINYVTRDGISALFLASERGHSKVVKKLLDRCADVNLCTRDGSSPLYIACQNGHVSTVITLLDAKHIDVHKSNCSGATPLFVACQIGNLEIVKQLIQRDADVNRGRNDYASPLFTACESGNSKVVKFLLQNDANVNKCNLHKKTPLYIACELGYLEMVKELLKKNADKNVFCTKGLSPLLIAHQKKQFEVVSHLLDMDKHIDINKSISE